VSGTSDHIVSDNSNLADDEYESDDEEDGYVSSSSQFSGEDSLLEDDHSLSGSSTGETELSETEQHTESDDTCDMHHDNISGPICDDMGIVTSVQS
jgi:hypothetical protein